MRRVTDLSVLDLRVGHRWGHQLEGCHESSGVALHLSGDLDLTGSHHDRLSAGLPAALLWIFSTDFWLGLWVPSWVYSQVSAAVDFHWAKKRAVLLKIKFAHLHKRPQPSVLRRRNTSTPPTSHSRCTQFPPLSRHQQLTVFYSNLQFGKDSEDYQNTVDWITKRVSSLCKSNDYYVNPIITDL